MLIGTLNSVGLLTGRFSLGIDQRYPATQEPKETKETKYCTTERAAPPSTGNSETRPCCSRRTYLPRYMTAWGLDTVFEKGAFCQRKKGVSLLSVPHLHSTPSHEMSICFLLRNRTYAQVTQQDIISLGIYTKRAGV